MKKTMECNDNVKKKCVLLRHLYGGVSMAAVGTAGGNGVKRESPVWTKRSLLVV